MKRNEINILLNDELKKMKSFKRKALKLDMSRGKPSREQLDISMELFNELTSSTFFPENADYRNYGINDGIPEIKKLLSEVLSIKEEEIIVSGNASLALMYDCLQRAMQFGVLSHRPWNKLEKVKWLCPVPGYDRHFAITELFGIEMINIPMTEKGPNMDLVEEYIKDDSVKGIWCVPKYSNPSGITYDSKVIERFAQMKPKAEDFRVFWDNAYGMHGLYGYDEMLDVYSEAKKYGNEDSFYIFGSTSKISFAGGGVAYMHSSKKNIDAIKKLMGIQSIGSDKLSQFSHAKFLKDKENILRIMQKHADILRPKFKKVIEILTSHFEGSNMATWTNPRGGYFISVDLSEGTAKRTLQIAQEAGVTFTKAGATFPYGIDPLDRNIRIAPSFPAIDELIMATEIFCCAVKIAYYEKQLGL